MIGAMQSTTSLKNAMILTVAYGTRRFLPGRRADPSWFKLSFAER